MTNPLTTWGKRIADARKAKGLSQTELAAAVGVAQPSVSRWEQDKVRPSDPEKIRIADVLGLSPADLFPWDEVAA